MTRPKTFRKTSVRDIRVAKVASAREAIGTIKPGSDTFILTHGQFSLIDALMVILDQAGPADVSLSTWTAADAHLESAAALMESAEIRSLRMIVDRSFISRQPGYCRHMTELFGGECIRAIKTHAKFMVVRSDTMDVVVRTSMNLNENPRLENIEISEGTEFADFFTDVVDTVFREVAPGDYGAEKPPALDGVSESFPFKEIEAKQLKRNDYNEPATTHTIRRSA